TPSWRPEGPPAPTPGNPHVLSRPDSGHNRKQRSRRPETIGGLLFIACFDTGDQTMATFPITRRGAEMLKTELHRLKTVDRPNVIQAIADARAQGDLSENADYDAAKERQGFIEGRIAEIE